MKPDTEKKNGVMFHVAEYESDGRVYRKWNFEKIAKDDETECSRIETLPPLSIVPSELMKKVKESVKKHDTPIQQTRKAKPANESCQESLVINLETEVSFESAKKPSKNARAISPLARRLKQQRNEAREAKEMHEDDVRRKIKEATSPMPTPVPAPAGNGNCQEMKRAIEDLNRKFDLLMCKVEQLSQENKKNKV